jgi:hypothetical protein
MKTLFILRQNPFSDPSPALPANGAGVGQPGPISLLHWRRPKEEFRGGEKTSGVHKYEAPIASPLFLYGRYDEE